MRILTEISPGELFDKITILEIKLERIPEQKKHQNVKKEYQILTAVRDEYVEISDALRVLVKALKEVNLKLWQIEDDIRDCEREKDFGSHFVALARAVYQENDRRADIKNKINQLLHSNLFEEKSYQAY
ncbi:MAG: DUF6165 family protein [Nitrospiria bacterium]